MKKPQSPFKGVSFHKPTNRWVPSVLMNEDETGKRKLKNLGYFDSDLEAALAKNKFIEEHNLTAKKAVIEGVTPAGNAKEVAKAFYSAQIRSVPIFDPATGDTAGAGIVCSGTHTLDTINKVEESSNSNV